MRSIIFLLFLVSGFCSILYQIVWLRLGFATFGVITPVLSVILSVFMMGLAAGSYLAGRIVQPLTERMRLSPVVLYGLVECGIACGAFIVPYLFDKSGKFLVDTGITSSSQFLFISAVLITVTVLGFTLLMGMTFPLMMAFMRSRFAASNQSFSYLYLGNVAGAFLGALLTAGFMVEMFGFRQTLQIAAAGNLLIGLVAFSLVLVPTATAVSAAERPVSRRSMGFSSNLSHTNLLILLCATGFASMAMEVVWARAFTPVLGTTIYAFAALLAVYLLATWMGSTIYLRTLAEQKNIKIHYVLSALAIASLLPLLAADPHFPRGFPAVLSIAPFSLLLGYLTPRLVDEYSNGEPRAAGLAYAVNVVGCVVGPLLAGYVLLPYLGVKWSLILLALPFFVMFAMQSAERGRLSRYVIGTAFATVLGVSVFLTSTYEDPALYGKSEVRRDHVATVVATGSGMDKRLFVNGVGITSLTPITKFMSHLPLVLLAEPPESTLAICFGMGTTFRSLASWGAATTAVELVPSVPDLADYFFSDARKLQQAPGKRVVIDDGRRFLQRTDEKFDVITIDPPPPVEAAGSSLLYSVEFYQLLKKRLAPKGLVQQWFPGGEEHILVAVANSLHQVFPHVRVFPSIEGWGYHFIASEYPVEMPDARLAVKRMPDPAVKDLMEWYPDREPEALWRTLMSKEVPLSGLVTKNSRPLITDNSPFNEYFFLRRTLGRSDMSFRAD